MKKNKVILLLFIIILVVIVTLFIYQKFSLKNEGFIEKNDISIKNINTPIALDGSTNTFLKYDFYIQGIEMSNITILNNGSYYGFEGSLGANDRNKIEIKSSLSNQQKEELNLIFNKYNLLKLKDLKKMDPNLIMCEGSSSISIYFGDQSRVFNRGCECQDKKLDDTCSFYMVLENFINKISSLSDN